MRPSCARTSPEADQMYTINNSGVDQGPRQGGCQPTCLERPAFSKTSSSALMQLREGSTCAICISSHTSRARFQSPRFPSCGGSKFWVIHPSGQALGPCVACSIAGIGTIPWHAVQQYLHDDGAVVGVRGRKAGPVHALQQVQRFVCLIVPLARCTIAQGSK